MGNSEPQAGATRRWRIAIVTTHPVQYHAHWFRAMAAEPDLDIHVFYGRHASGAEQADAGFGVAFDWDVPLLEGYPHTFLKSAASSPSTRTFFGLNTPELHGIIARGGFDAVLVNGWHYYSAWQAMMACWRHGVPVMARGDSHLHSPRPALRELVKAVPYRGFIRRLDACLAAGTWSSEYFRHYGARPERIFCVPHTVEREKFEAAAAELEPRRADLRSRWRLTPDLPTFLFAGKFIAKKHPMHLLRAAELAQREGAPLQVLMVGDGPLRAECEEFCRSRKLPVQFAGFLNQSAIPAAYVAADALVLPSDGGETWGLVANEAMTCGRPCLVSDKVGCSPDLVMSGRTGDCFEFGNIAALAKLLVRYALEKQFTRMGAEARAHVRAVADVSVAVAGVRQAVRAVSDEPK